MRNHMHITKSPQMHQLNSLDLLFRPYLPIYGPVWLHWPYFTVLAHNNQLNNQTKPILAHIYPLIYINLHVKYGKYLIRTFWVKIQNMKIYFYFFGVRGGGGGVHKIQGTGTPKCQQMHISSQWRHIHTYIWENNFFFKCIFLAIWGALGGAFSDQTERSIFLLVRQGKIEW